MSRTKPATLWSTGMPDVAIYADGTVKLNGKIVSDEEAEKVRAIVRAAWGPTIFDEVVDAMGKP